MKNLVIKVNVLYLSNNFYQKLIKHYETNVYA